MNTPSSPKAYRTIWISDVHLGSRGCQAERLLEFLRQHPCERLYLVGDIIDVWALRRGEIAINYGNFITALVTFLITAAVVYYAVVLPLGRLNERLGLAPKAAGPTAQEQLLTEIRDLLKKP